MAISAILGSVLQAALTQSTQSKFKQFKQEFQQLGQDLQSGNLAQAQSDFATLQQNSPSSLQSTAATSATTSSNPIAQAFNQLAQDLKAGNVTAAQQDFSTIQQDFQNRRAQGAGHHHHHVVVESQSSQSTSPIAQLFSQLGQALQTGSLSGAQQAYSTLQHDFQQFESTSSAGGTSSGVSLSA
jgi:outer membrane protein assembly factor BamD (BamD/ComL family)